MVLLAVQAVHGDSYAIIVCCPYRLSQSYKYNVLNLDRYFRRTHIYMFFVPVVCVSKGGGVVAVQSYTHSYESSVSRSYAGVKHSTKDLLPLTVGVIGSV